MRRTFLFFAAVLFLFSFCITASSHSGKTDSSGGHTDHSTGDYHYHHGYPAHDHYDMDGDGDLDCPYDFDIKKSSNGTGLSTGITSPYAYSGNKDNIITKTETITKEVPYIPQWIYWVIGILTITCIGMFVVIKWKNEEIQNLETQFKNEDKKHKDEIAKLKKKLSESRSACPPKSAQNIIMGQSTRFSIVPPSKVSIEELTDKAINWGVSFEIAKRLINYERKDRGLPPVEFEEDE